MMTEYMGLNRFKAVYIVDLCHSLCQQAKQKVQQKGWKNVHVIEGDACTFQPPEGIATLVTFSYSLSSTPPPSLHQGLSATSASEKQRPHVCCSGATFSLCC